ncbi:hypothetical protein ZWY2020_006908 [Hordeum vulgare]|nr:hypothetical protein ZWY2020_006908 [Hordeum vulgare]
MDHLDLNSAINWNEDAVALLPDHLDVERVDDAVRERAIALLDAALHGHAVMQVEDAVRERTIALQDVACHRNAVARVDDAVLERSVVLLDGALCGNAIVRVDTAIVKRTVVRDAAISEHDILHKQAIKHKLAVFYWLGDSHK